MISKLLIALGLIVILLFTIYFAVIFFLEKKFVKEVRVAEKVSKKEEQNVEYPFVEPEEGVPKKIMQTYKSIDNVPKFVLENIQTSNPDWKYVFIDDNEAVSFLIKEYPPEVLEKFNSFSRGAHRADLFRLCWLYKNGGAYVDIDTYMLKPLTEIVKDKELIIPVTEVIRKRKRLLNCFMVSNKGNPLIMDCIKAVMKVEDTELKKNYCLILIVMQNALEGKYEYEFFEKMSLSIRSITGDWNIYDKQGVKIAESRYKNYNRVSGFN